MYLFGCTESWLPLGVFSSCGEHELPQKNVAIRWGVGASPHSGFSGSGAQAVQSLGSWALEHRLSSCGAPAYLLQGMWDLFGSRIKPVSPELAGGFFTTEPPGKPQK